MTNGNLMPGYRQVLEAEEMDSSQRNQNGRVDDCRKTGHSLMSLVLFVFLAMAVILPQCSASDPCSNKVEVIDRWRDVSILESRNVAQCDKRRFDPNTWYSFSLGGRAAAIPTTCIKNNMCGSQVAMRVDLQGQGLPENVGDNITAALCGSYDVLGKFDCCVLRSVVNIARCPNDRIVYNFPSQFDRCPVAICAQEQSAEVPDRAVAKMGEDVSKAGATPTTATTDSTVSEGITTDNSSPDSLMGLGETSESQHPQELNMQQTTISELSTDVDNTTITYETPNEVLNKTTNATIDLGSDIQTISVISGLSTESQTLALSTINTNDLFVTTDDQQTDILFTDVTTEAFITDTTTQSIESSPEVSTEYLATELNNTNQNITSETITDSSSTTELQSTSIEHSSNPTTTSIEHSSNPTTTSNTDETVSVSNKLLLDQLSTVTTFSEENSTSDNVTGVTELKDVTGKSSTDSLFEPTSEARTKLDIPTATFYTTNSSAAHIKPSTNMDLAADTTTTTKRSSLDEISTPPRSANVTQTSTWSIIKIEKIRFVFKGNPSSVVSPVTVSVLLNQFMGESQHTGTYQLTSISGAVDFEGRKTFMDFQIELSSNEKHDIFDTFRESNLKRYLSKHANLTLLDQCHISDDCQFDRSEGVAEPSTFQSNAPAFITVIILCSICLLVLVVALLYSHFSKRGSWKATSDIDIPENRHYISGNQSPFTDAQIMKDEMVDNASFNGSAKDGGDTNLHSTWVIPLDQDPDAPKTVVAITTEDTKF